MRVRTAAVISLAVLAAASSADAAPKKKPKPITKNYTVQAVPYPKADAETSCEEPPEQAVNHTTISVTGPGKLVVTVSGFTGDWDVAVFNDKTGSLLGEGSGVNADDVPPHTGGKSEVLKYTSKKAQKLRVDVCNFAGSPTANVKLVYTYL